MNIIKKPNLVNHMTMNYFDQRRKGQSAIEYLTTYGWMLLVVAIVGGAIFTTVQNQANVSNTSGFSNADVQVENFGLTGGDGGNISLELRNAASDSVEITNVSIGTQTNTTDALPEIPIGETGTVDVGGNGDGFQESDSQNELDVVITYNAGNLDSLQVSGTITANLEEA